MNIKILLIFALMFAINSTNADSQSYSDIIQRQSKQIQELNNRVLDLENSIKKINFNLEENGIVAKQSNFSMTDLEKFIQENSTKEQVLSNGNSNFLEDKNGDIARSKDKSDYDLALATLKEGKFDIAEKQFFNFIMNYPSSLLQSNATFWYSETFYRRNIFDKSAINYLKSYKKYPTGPKAADALLKLAYSLASLNKNKEACSILNKLESEFPERPIDSIKRAEDARNKFHCK